MSKRQFKSQASSSKASFPSGSTAFGAPVSSFATPSSSLSYLCELPDISSISDAHTIVLFKNLSKKDSITKGKALEELQDHLFQKDKELEDVVLNAWLNFYPRTSIDNDKRVRQLAHTLQGQISISSGRRIAKYMSKVVGAWLAGMYDNDKLVAKAAQISVDKVFPTLEKKSMLYKAYQIPILDFCSGIIRSETPQTLSDERIISPDEAEAKYSRTLSAALGLLSRLMSELSHEDYAKNRDRYEEIFQDRELWKMASNDDVGIRRAMHKMLRSVIQSTAAKAALNPEILSEAYIYKALDSDQTGSANEYVDTLLALTTFSKDVWLESYHGKKSVSSRLKHFVKRGSQSAPLNYWTNIQKLFNFIPPKALPDTSPDAMQLLKGLYSGVTKKDEPKIFITAGLQAYVEVAKILSSILSAEDRFPLLKESVLPIIHQYAQQDSKSSEWSVPELPGNRMREIIASAIRIHGVDQLLQAEWPSLCETLITDFKTSLPEQAQAYETSQSKLVQRGQRWALVQAAMIANYPTDVLLDKLSPDTVRVLEEALKVSASRRGKPYGAAATVAAAVQSCGQLFLPGSPALRILEDFALTELPDIFVSPSSKYFASILFTLKDRKFFDRAWTAAVKAVLAAPESESQHTALKELVSGPKPSSTTNFDEVKPYLQAYVLHQTHHTLNSTGDWTLITTLLNKSSTASEVVGIEALSALTEALSISDPRRTSQSLEALKSISRANPTLLQSFIPTEAGKTIAHKILVLTESADDAIAHSAADFNSILHSLSRSHGSAEGGHHMTDVIRNSLKTATKESILVETLIDQAFGLVDAKVASLSDVLPETADWSNGLRPFFTTVPTRAFAITHPMGGAVFLVQPETSDGARLLENTAPSDASGFSVPLRMAFYTAKLLQKDDAIVHLDSSSQGELFRLLSITVQLANDNLSVAGSNNLWSIYTLDIENEMAEFVAEAQKLLNSWLQNYQGNEVAEYEFVRSAIDSFLDGSNGTSPESYYNAKAYCEAVTELVEHDTWDSGDLEARLRSLRASKNHLQSAAFLASHKPDLAVDPISLRFCNEMIADLADLRIADKQAEGLQKLILLNVMLRYPGDENVLAAKILPQRRVRLVMRAVGWLDENSLSSALRAEIFRILYYLLPEADEVPESFWSQALSAITDFWKGLKTLDESPPNSLLPPVYASLKLFQALELLAKDEASEDLRELLDQAWKNSEESPWGGLLNLFALPRNLPDDHHQPLQIVNELICRQLNKHPNSPIPDVKTLYPLLYTDSRSIQDEALALLEVEVQRKQEDISIDALLNKSSARLPDELLSLILENPTANTFDPAVFDRTMPLPLQGYLHSWRLVLDHFRYASHKVRSDYNEQLKEGGYLNGFLDFIFDFLGHDKGKPVDAFKFPVTSPPNFSEDSPLKYTQKYLTHLYYLCLVHLSTQTKTWWIECTSRTRVLAVEAWTEKFISAHVISTALITVEEWAKQSQPDEEIPQLSVRVNPRASEVVASYKVDEDQSATISISFPPSFPLQQATVGSSQSRVAVEAKQWTSWLRITQGVIATSNNSIVDGLLSWRRNMYGALKGQEDCAICYSVVGEDGRVPNKKCRTCKNTFHANCLYKWFKSSNNTTCPLCRTNFNFDGRGS
ncbi:hypothetical protein EJ06DRAFT_490803 [Trichodelitschia bisporula]|uniref:E3 ubiquitin-protein ligase listerin n=1 Tax=Trichodelitschia bisporula TaxID=703511 RepID=A0A6G1I339_9PEZI|nr:hypothetical protein EJ06DRAFT_490803 [Trichodelitschia bisporula]